MTDNYLDKLREITKEISDEAFEIANNRMNYINEKDEAWRISEEGMKYYRKTMEYHFLYNNSRQIEMNIQKFKSVKSKLAQS